MLPVLKKFSIPIFSILPGIPTPSPHFADWFHSDKICVNGLQSLGVFTSLGYDKKHIELTGSPKYDYFKTIDSDKSKTDLEKNQLIDRKKKLVVIAMSRWHENDEIWMSELIRFCNKNNFQIIIKVHLTYKMASQNVSENKIKKITELCNDLKYNIIYEIDIPTLLSAADLVITEYSSVGLEAILLEKPLLTVNFSKEIIESYLRFYDYDASIYVEDINNLKKIILDIFDSVNI